ncbi:MAG: uroporphyrinogen decarboxylase family protein [Kiritimatiellae bacterium]|nr:uroporphyrinogen decarboxylase family protein [Kiritimatiellia bacterium]
MKRKDILFNALQGKETPRAAWVPFTGVHAAALIDEKACDYLQSSELIIKGIKEAVKLYSPDGIPVIFDLQTEAEVLGCELKWADEAPPSVVNHPLEMGKTLADLPEFDLTKGRFPAILEATRVLKNDLDDVALYGLICGPFTLALHLLGNNIFLEMYDNPDYIIELMEYCKNIAVKVAEAYIDAGCDVIAVVDPMTSQISPDHFEEFITKPLNGLFDFVRSKGAFSSLFVCGDATRNLDVMFKTSCDNISVDENIPMDMVKGFAVESKKSFGGNLKLTTVLLLGSEDDSKLDAINCLDIGGHKGYIIAPGCDIPYSVPPANIIAVSEVILDEYKREIARKIVAREADIDVSIADLPDEFNDTRVDIITLDSKACPPCQYMLEAVNRAVEQIDSDIVVKEHKITDKEGIAAMVKLGVKNIPTICINGKVAFSSIIPDTDKLVAAIRSA